MVLVLLIISPFKIPLQATKRLAHPCYVLHSFCLLPEKETSVVNRPTRPTRAFHLSVCMQLGMIFVGLSDRQGMSSRPSTEWGPQPKKNREEKIFTLLQLTRSVSSRPSTRRSTRGRSTSQGRSVHTLSYFSHAGKDRPKFSLHLFLNLSNILISINVSLTLLQDQVDVSSYLCRSNKKIEKLKNKIEKKLKRSGGSW